MSNRPLPACCIAETLGTFLLVFFGCGAVHVAVLTGDLQGLWQVGIVWGVSIMLAIYVVGSISGAHINPAITLGLATWGLFPWSRVPGYVLSQMLGAILAAAVLFTLFEPYLAAKEAQKGIVRGGAGSELTAMCYGEYFPNPGGMAGSPDSYDAAVHADHNKLVTEPLACLIEVIGTAILALVVMAVTDSKNQQGPGAFAPVFIGLTVAALICVIAPLTQACFNPARDFGPRLFAYFAGWGSIAIPGAQGTGFLTVYIVSPIVGALLGTGLYQGMLGRWVGQHEAAAPSEAA
ncbi:Glycerol uptake facilitator protein [Rosistilla carotiformis]|uniref:Glycerol uptake facilitator protein n=1 Tax=Rosistilla carotiformis TaxID=2528017 RepID=A0A518JXK1_9BACT|nr:MIP/aquaporin family protein [Rosistilla carotiformis]QDV70270.1 Glycerol uptake facilitator protein [Rosistilla carotiformis]